MKKPVDPLEELHEIKRKLSRELEEARKKGKYMGKLREYEGEVRKALRPKKKAHVR
jgi:DNA invertase Pin-like site-specific DNA recombinase